MVKGSGKDNNSPSSVNKGWSNLGDNAILEELNKSVNLQNESVLDSQLELLLLLQHQKQQQRQQSGKDDNFNTSSIGSMPPTVEGASSTAEGLIRNPNYASVDNLGSVSHGDVIDAETRSHPAYLAYYYSNVNNNPRLPPPLLSLEEWRIFQRFQEVGSSIDGEFGEWRNKDFVEDGESPMPYQMQRGTALHKAEDDLIEMRKTAARNLSRISSSESMEGSSLAFAGAEKSGIGARRKSFEDMLQGGLGKSSTPPSRLSRPGSYNSLSDLIDHASNTSELHDKVKCFEALHPGQLSLSTLHGSAFPEFLKAESGPSLTKIKTSEPYRPLKPPPGFPSRSNRVSIDREENRFHSNLHGPSYNNTENSDIPTFSGISVSKGQANAGFPSQSGVNNFLSLTDYINFIMENDVEPDTNSVHLERQLDFPKRASSMVNLQSLANSLECSTLGDAKLDHQGNNFPKRASSLVNLQSLANSFESSMLADSSNQGIKLTSAILEEERLRRSSILGYSNHYPTNEHQTQYVETSDDYGRNTVTMPRHLSSTKNAIGTSYSADDLLKLCNICKEGMLAHQKQQDQQPFIHKPGRLNHQYHGNPGCGPYSYKGNQKANSARPAGKSGGHFQKGGASRFSNAYKNKEGVVSSVSRNSEGKTSMEGKLVSGLLQELKISKSLELSDVLNDIVGFSKDQHGSRFLQQKIETATVEEKINIFEQIIPHARDLMTDVFGNYVIQKFFEKGTESQRRELASLVIGHVLPLSLQMYGCRVIQKALEVIDVEQQTKIMRELDGSIMKCVHDQNGNHVIQKCIECVPQDQIQFIISSFFGQVVALSTHPYGCRVIQRVLEHCDPHTQLTVMDEIMNSVCTLAQDQYGNYVIQHVLQHGKPHERSAIIAKLTGQIVKMGQQKFASNVVEKCLTFAAPEERKVIVNEMLGSTDDNEVLQAMMKDPFGNYVVQKVLETCDDQDRELILSRIRVHLDTLKKYTYAKHIVTRVEKLIEGGERQTEMSKKKAS